jgi:excinuclease ABC subunit B
VAYNKKHGITPQSIQKKINEIIDQGGVAVHEVEDILGYQKMSDQQLTKELTILEKNMLTHAENLEFEQAAKIRDQINKLQQYHLGIKG